MSPEACAASTSGLATCQAIMSGWCPPASTSTARPAQGQTASGQAGRDGVPWPAMAWSRSSSDRKTAETGGARIGRIATEPVFVGPEYVTLPNRVTAAGAARIDSMDYRPTWKSGSVISSIAKGKR